MKKFRKIIAVILIFAMLFSISGMEVIAQEITNAIEVISTANAEENSDNNTDESMGSSFCVENGHSFSTEWTIDIEPTCETMGSKSYHCINCGEMSQVTEMPALGHNPDWETTKAPTELDKGERVKKCLNCEKIYAYEDIPIVPVGYIGVYDPQSLDAMRNNLGGNYVLLCDIDMRNATAKGGCCDFNGNGWNPIGSGDNYGTTAFTGTLNGNFHSITGLRIEINKKPANVEQKICVGVFSYLTGTVENLYLEDINYTLGSFGLSIRCGGIAARTGEPAIIHQVVVSGEIKSYTPGYYGGISGAYYDNDSLKDTYITSSINYTNLHIECSSEWTCVGGISGNGDRIKHQKCANFGTLYLKTNDTSWVGGITAALNSGEISDCYNAGDVYHYGVHGFNYNRYEAKTAGIASDLANSPTIKNCYNVGNIFESVDGTSWYRAFGTISPSSSYSTLGNTYFLEGTGIASEKYSISKTKSLTHEQMLDQANFEGFSFGDVWYHDISDEDYVYPKLKAHIFGDNCNHSYTDWIIDSQATCTTAGIKHKYCILCKDIVFGEDPALGHNRYEEWTIESEATCTTSGLMYHSCSRCNDKADITVIPPLGHSYSDWEITTPATCTTDGVQTSTCATCGATETKTILAYGHTYSTRWTIDKAATCTEVGSKSHHCLRCSEKADITEIPAKGHNFTDWNVDVPPTCTDTGSNYRICLDCGIEELQDVSATGHTVGDWIIEVEPGCVTEGSKYQYCSACSTKIYETIPATGHNYSANWVVDIEATCTESGSKSHHCATCGEKTDVTEIPALNHDFSDIWTIDTPATCTEAGSKSHHCLRCEEKADVTEIEATGHTYSTWYLDTAPTCTAEGSKYQVCESCGDTQYAAMNALGHDYSDTWTVDVPASCTTEGSKSHHCTRCDSKSDITKIAATGHFYGGWDITIEPTCEKAGERTHSCELCGHSETLPISAYGHNYSTRWTIDVEPTCLAEGLKSHHCLRCDNKTDETVIEVSGHIFGQWYVAEESTMDKEGIKAHDCYNCDLTETQAIPKLAKYTATYIADGEVVAVVDFPEDATSIDEPAVPQKNRYTGKWEYYEPENKNIVIHAEYTKIASENMNKITANHTADYYSSSGEVEINLNVSSPSKNIIISSSKSVPLDIVLVLDQSGSMEGAKRDALASAVTDFSNSVLENSIKNNVEHRIAIVGFGMGNDDYGRFGSSDYIARYENTNILTTDGEPVSYGNVKDADYANALKTVNDNGSLNESIIRAINNIDAKGATMANLGLEMAASIFANTSSEGRERIVVFFTDGVPTSGSSFEFGVANAALENAHQIKDTYNANIYSVGLFDKDTTNNKNVNNFMNYVSSNYSEKHLLNSKKNEKTPSPADYYLNISDSENLSEIFKSIAEESVIQTGQFENATIHYTLSKYFTLTSVQESELRNAFCEKFGVNESDVLVARDNDKGTTLIEIKNVNPVLSNNEFVIDVTFRATANGDTRRSGTYAVNTLDSGVYLPGSVEYEEVFDAKTVDLIGTSGIATFTINGIPYSVERLTSSEKVIAPDVSFDEDYQFSGWNIPANTILNNSSVTYDANLTKNQYCVTWNVDGNLFDVYYDIGDVIAIPTVTFDSTGDLFIGWDKEVPYTMPAENLTFTALYDVHYHHYEVTKDFKDCTQGGTLYYECECGDNYTETIEPENHTWVAISGNASETYESHVGFRCSECGALDDNALAFQRTGIEKDGNGNNKSAQYELNYENKSTGEHEQPNDNVVISTSLEDVFGNELEEGQNVVVYRINDDDTREIIHSTTDGSYVTFETNHFSTYVFELEGEKTELDYDINGDGVLDELDYNMIIQASICAIKLTDEQKLKADVNGDGAVDTFDAIELDLIINNYIPLG